MRMFRSLRVFSACLHKKVCSEVFKNVHVRTVIGECCVFQDRPVTQSPSPIAGETTAVVLHCIRNIQEWISDFDPNVSQTPSDVS